MSAFSPGKRRLTVVSYDRSIEFSFPEIACLPAHMMPTRKDLRDLQLRVTYAIPPAGFVTRCMLWKGSDRILFKNQRFTTKRLFYSFDHKQGAKASIGKAIKSLCRVAKCVRPDHLFAQTMVPPKRKKKGAETAELDELPMLAIECQVECVPEVSVPSPSVFYC